jgi:hypothetical protein
MGYNWRNIVAVDYAFAAHPYLDESHRVALRFTPSFPNFEGRNFRPNTTITVPREKQRPVYPSPRDPGTKIPDPSVKPAQPAPDTEAPVDGEFEEELEEGEFLEH